MKKSVLTALAISIAVGGLGLTTVASASPRGGNMPSFADFDTDSNGVITQAEIDAIGAAKFLQNDINGDGFLDAEEFAARKAENNENRRGGDRGHGDDRGQRGHGAKWQNDQVNPELMEAQQQERMALAITHMMQRADTDGDGKLSIDEVRPPKAGQMFERLDTDGNGEVSQAEWDAAMAQRGNQRGNQRGDHRGNQHSGQQGNRHN